MCIRSVSLYLLLALCCQFRLHFGVVTDFTKRQEFHFHRCFSLMMKIATFHRCLNSVSSYSTSMTVSVSLCFRLDKFCHIFPRLFCSLPDFSPNSSAYPSFRVFFFQKARKPRLFYARYSAHFTSGNRLVVPSVWTIEPMKPAVSAVLVQQFGIASIWNILETHHNLLTFSSRGILIHSYVFVINIPVVL